MSPASAAATGGSKVAGFANSPTVHSTNSINSGEWTHLAFVRYADAAGGYVRLFVNGQPEATDSSNGKPASDAQVVAIAANLLDGRFYAGAMDDLRFYNSALSDTEIVNVYNVSQNVSRWTTNTLPPGLIAWWTAEGNAKDATANHHDGTASGGVSYMPGTFGSGIAFDGTNGVVEVPDSPALQLTNALTIEFWAKRERSGIDFVLEKGGDWNSAQNGEANYGVSFHSGNNRMFYFTFRGGWRGTSGVADFEWHHYAVVATNGSASPAFYIDGLTRPVEFSEGAAAINLYPSARPLHLGSQLSPDWNYFGNNLLDDVRLYNRALSAAEIAYLYAGPVGATFIDSFAVGPQIQTLGPGDAYWSETANGLDPAQVIGGSRQLVIQADGDAAFRTLEAGMISVAINGSVPGSLSIQAAIPDPAPASSYEPVIIQAYDGFSEDWSAFDRIVIRFSTPPDTDVQLQTSINSAGNGSWADTTVPGGSQSVTILFSDLNGAFTPTDVNTLDFQWTLPRESSLVLRDIQVMGASVPELPRLNISPGGGVTLNWPTNAAGFFLESSTSLAAPFTPVTNAPLVVGTNCTVTLPTAEPMEFFRLHKL